MLKFLVISFLLFFIMYKLLGFFFRMLIKSSISNHQQQYAGKESESSRRKPTDGNVNIDYIPKNGKKDKSTSHYNGGEYIDYEEVK